MNPQSTVDELLVEAGLDPADPDNAAAIVRDMLALNQINAYVHLFREWEWTYVDGSTVFAADDTDSLLPTDFLSFGKWGQIYDESNNEVGIISMSQLQRMRRAGSTLRRVCSQWAGALTLTSPYSTDTTWALFYRVRPDPLTYDTTPMRIPDRYKDLVIIPGLRMKLMKNKADGRDWNSEFKAGLSLMCAEERPMMSRQRSLPRVISASSAS